MRSAVSATSSSGCSAFVDATTNRTGTGRRYKNNSSRSVFSGACIGAEVGVVAWSAAVEMDAGHLVVNSS